MSTEIFLKLFLFYFIKRKLWQSMKNLRSSLLIEKQGAFDFLKSSFYSSGSGPFQVDEILLEQAVGLTPSNFLVSSNCNICLLCTTGKILAVYGLSTQLFYVYLYPVFCTSQLQNEQSVKIIFRSRDSLYQSLTHVKLKCDPQWHFVWPPKASKMYCL